MASDDRTPASPESPHPDSPVVSTPHDHTHDAAHETSLHDVQQIRSLAANPPPGASVYQPGSVVSDALNPRSCVTCRRRKVRCDKHMPCGNCRRGHIPCIFPAPGRAPRRPRPKDPNAPPKHPSTEREVELVKRLRKLEGIVEELSAQIELEASRHPSSAGNSPEALANPDAESVAGGAGGVGGHAGRATSIAGSSQSHGSPAIPGRAPTTQASSFAAGCTEYNTPDTGSSGASIGDVRRKFGRLVLNDKGVTRYVSSGFWSKINDELDEIRRETQQMTDEDTDDSDHDTSPESVDQRQKDKTSQGHQAFIFGYRSADVDLRPLHPLPSQIPFMWQMYLEHVDPIVKILHVPTTTKLCRAARNNLDSLTPSNEALMFSIYYAAITSMEDDEVKKNFGHEKDSLMSQYRFALEQALAQANFITAPDVTICQALLLFLVLVRRHDDARFSWTLTGLLIRISQSLGLHRDGTNFPNLTPFEIEMRRRVFWAICMLDLRSAEDQGTDLTIVDRTFDTQIPLNINDTDISPESTELPEPREGPTDCTFAIIRYEIFATSRRIHTASSAMANVCPKDASKTMKERESMLMEMYQRISQKYLGDPATEANPVFWVATNVARVIVAKMMIVIYQPALFPGPGNENLSDEDRDRVFMAATEVFEYNHLLNTDPRCRPWRWLFQTYTQWHALAYVLLQTAQRPWSASVERAWAALNSAFMTPWTQEIQQMAKNAIIWVPFKKLFLKARKHREAEIARLRADPQAAMKLDLEERAKSKAAPNSFNALSGSVKSAIAHERWRKLVNAPPIPPELMTASPQPARTQSMPVAPQEMGGGSGSSGPMRSNTVNNMPHVVPPTMPTEDMVMNAIDMQFSSPQLHLPDLFSLAWAPEAESVLNPDVARSMVYGIGGSDIPRMDNHVLMMQRQAEEQSGQKGVSVPNQSMGGVNGGAMAYQQQQPQQQEQTNMQTSPLYDERHPPPWLWSSVTGVSNGGNANGGMMGGLNAGVPEPIPNTNFPGMQLDDVDVNMDEGFDWQNWQENLGKFEMETSGPSGGTWGL